MSAPETTMVRIDGGQFAMGSDDHYADEGPVRQVAVDGFWIDPRPVTNRRFAGFVESTGYVTVAEQPPDPALYPGAPAENLVPGSMLFTMTAGPVDLRDWSQWWRWTPGANWRSPAGPDTSLDGLEDHPVVHVAFPDVLAYSSWENKALPTEAEWEIAARGGLDGAEFVWGNEDQQDTEPLANTWQGSFPYENMSVDGWDTTSPVGLYPPNGFGLYDMAGNVWEWTDDWYQARRVEPDEAAEAASCAPSNPRGGNPEMSLDPTQPDIPIPRKVVKGGSHLCTIQYCYRYRPAARQPQMIDTGLSNLGFRCIVRDA
jgi:formylglycine-generating enzyme required for sulfatase activity